MSDIALTASQRTSLLSLQDTQNLSNRTQTRLSTGRAVNSVVDDAVSFFRAKGLSDRASDFDLKKTEIDQGISSLNTALTAIEATRRTPPSPRSRKFKTRTNNSPTNQKEHRRS